MDFLHNKCIAWEGIDVPTIFCENINNYCFKKKRHLKEGNIQFIQVKKQSRCINQVINCSVTSTVYW